MAVIKSTLICTGTSYCLACRIFLLVTALLVSQASSQVRIVSRRQTAVSIINGHYRAVCVGTSTQLIENIEWLRDGMLLQPNNDTIRQEFDHITQVGTLFLRNLSLDFNDTIIRCKATRKSENFIKLLIQGRLGEVGSLRVEVNSSNIYLTWTAPFSLNISGEDRNIKNYCVNVSENYINSNSSEYRSCSITETEYNYSLFSSSCYSYQFVVYAVNLVGEGAPASESYAKNQISSEVTNITRLDHTLQSEFFTYRITMSTEVCGINVTFMDRDTGDKAPFYVNETFLKLEESNKFITFTTEQLTPRRHYDIILEILKNNGAKTIDQTNISTHGIMDVAPTKNNESVEISYYVPSDVSGALLNFVLLSGTSDILSSFIMPLDRNTPTSHTLPFDLYPGHYRIYVYDIEQDGTLYNGVGYPASSTNATFRDPEDAAQSQEQSSDIKCKVSSSSRVIEAECSDIMATGFQVIAQLINISEIQNLYVNKSMDLQTPVMVQVDNYGEYQITIFPISEKMGILDYGGVKYEEKVAVTRDSGTTSTLVLVLVLVLGVLGAIVVVMQLIAMAVYKTFNKNKDKRSVTKS